MYPLFAFRILGSAAWVRRKTAVTSTLSKSTSAAEVWLINLPFRPYPALLISTPTARDGSVVSRRCSTLTISFSTERSATIISVLIPNSFSNSSADFLNRI